MIIDSHCHLDYDPLNKDLKAVLYRANKVGVKFFLTICTTDESFEKIKIIINKNNNVFGSYGIHPHDTKNYGTLTVNEIIKNANSNNKIIGIGETGLDFYYNNSDKNLQKTSFVKHIQASQETSKPLIVHSRNADKDMLDVLKSEKKNKDFKILMHCFTGNNKFANSLMDLDCFFSASGIITFKKSLELRETFKLIPDDRILIETDSPYLSPEPHRGKTNEPSFLVHVLKIMSEIKGLDEKDLAKTTTQNFKNLFNLKI